MLVNYYLICIAQYPCSTELQDSAVHGLYKNIWPSRATLYITGEEGSGVDTPSHSVNWRSHIRHEPMQFPRRSTKPYATENGCHKAPTTCKCGRSRTLTLVVVDTEQNDSARHCTAVTYIQLDGRALHSRPPLQRRALLLVLLLSPH